MKSALPMADILFTMAGNLFDVFVVGSADTSSVGISRLAAALSTKHGIPLSTITKAIAAKNLRAGQGLEQTVAQTLVRQLQSIGAVTVIRPANTPTHHPNPSSPPPMALPTVAGSTQPIVLVDKSNPFTEVTDPSPATFGPPLNIAKSVTGLQLGTGSPPLARKIPGAPTAANPFEPPRSITPVLEITREKPIGTPTPQSHIRPSKDDLFASVASGPRLELARGDRATSADELSGLRRLPTNASGTNLRELGLTGKSGVEADRDPKNINLVRCVQHGLYYDKTKASGCRKCLSVARQMAGHIQGPNPKEQNDGGFNKNPTKWAFLGLAFALLIGLLPAAYYALGPGTAQAKHHRVEQEILSRQPGSEEILRRFDELERQIDNARSRSFRNTGIIWITISAIAMGGWFKLK